MTRWAEIIRVTTYFVYTNMFNKDGEGRICDLDSTYLGGDQTVDHEPQICPREHLPVLT